MNVIVTDNGFSPDNWLSSATNAPSDPTSLDLASDIAPETLAGKLDGVTRIRVDFPSFADGRGFTIARLLRLMGYNGVLRARGYLIADQYAMARRSGFDEVEISPELAARQPEPDWRARSDWRAHDYQSRLRAAV